MGVDPRLGRLPGRNMDGGLLLQEPYGQFFRQRIGIRHDGSSPLFDGIDADMECWMSHTDQVMDALDRRMLAARERMGRG